MSLNIDPLLVDDVVAFFYRTVQKKLSSMQHQAVNVPNIGTFVLKQERVKRKLEKYNGFLERIDASESMSMYETTVDVKNDIEKYTNVLQSFEQEALRKKEVQTKKEKFLDNVE